MSNQASLMEDDAILGKLISAFLKTLLSSILLIYEVLTYFPI